MRYICQKNTNMVKAFRVIGLLEGLSYILLLGIGVPMKYLFNDPTWVKMLGMPHGILFIAYVALAYYICERYKLGMKVFGFFALASILPFGTFYMDKKYLKDLKTA